MAAWTVATPGEWQCKTARSGEWAQHFSNASCLILVSVGCWRQRAAIKAATVMSLLVVEESLSPVSSAPGGLWGQISAPVHFTLIN